MRVILLSQPGSASHITQHQTIRLYAYTLHNICPRPPPRPPPRPRPPPPPPPPTFSVFSVESPLSPPQEDRGGAKASSRRSRQTPSTKLELATRRARQPLAIASRRSHGDHQKEKDRSSSFRTISRGQQSSSRRKRGQRANHRAPALEPLPQAENGLPPRRATGIRSGADHYEQRADEQERSSAKLCAPNVLPGEKSDEETPPTARSSSPRHLPRTLQPHPRAKAPHEDRSEARQTAATINQRIRLPDVRDSPLRPTAQLSREEANATKSSPRHYTTQP